MLTERDNPRRRRGTARMWGGLGMVVLGAASTLYPIGDYAWSFKNWIDAKNSKDKAREELSEAQYPIRSELLQYYDDNGLWYSATSFEPMVITYHADEICRDADDVTDEECDEMGALLVAYTDAEANYANSRVREYDPARIPLGALATVAGVITYISGSRASRQEELDAEA